ncbi:MAG: ATP synthase subunit B family protein [Acidimicrobiales bacterium]
MTDLFEDPPAGGSFVAPDAESNAETVIRQVIDLVNAAKAMPLSASVLVSRDEIIERLSTALDRLPDEVRQARWLLREREEFMVDRAREAEALMEEVRAQAERMVSRTEVVRQANQVAQRILDDANEEARRMRHEAEDYCDQKLAGMEIVLERIMRTVQSGREKLQATAPVSEPVVSATIGGEGGSGDDGVHEDGFFDQDRA